MHAQGVSTEVIRKILGHNDLEMTGHYIHPYNNEFDATAFDVERFVEDQERLHKERRRTLKPGETEDDEDLE